ncbi:chitobiase/beta-hexosaminidase C-terminal domain-containing protein [Pendulispora albinea]|uniref:Chitobiase/beta-hexosaminidase C-terminal domain-containing protein n=1 Tax=Pendulispora albinea TaxID=2741071 RepID=A0ABZ2MAG5_9BACT
MAACFAVAGMVGVAGCGGTDPDATGSTGEDVSDVSDEPGVVATPQFDPPQGAFTAARNISLATATAGATIRYTVDGTTPDATSPAYVGPVAIARTMTIKAIAFKSGWQPSGVQSVTYFVDIPMGTVAPVEFVPGSGDFSNDVTVSLSSQTEGATICYTLDGSLPVCDAGQCGGGSTRDAASVPAEVTATGQRIRAIACKSGMDTSSETYADYTLTAAAPTFDPPPGVIDPTRRVKVTTTTHGAEIHYRLDGARPNCYSPILEGGTFPDIFTSDTTVRALACKKNYVRSTVVDANYLGPKCPSQTVTTRAQLEALSRCTTIAGSLRISSLAGVTDLAPLSRLQRIESSLIIEQNPDLRSLHGLESLTSVGYDMSVRGNDALSSLGGLEKLASVGYELYVGYNPQLTSLNGLDALTSVGTNLEIAGNAALTRIDGFPSLQTVGIVLQIRFNGATEWIGPRSLTRVMALSIIGEKKLLHVGGFPALKEIHGLLDVSNNDVLAEIDDMPALTKIGSTATFTDNPALAALPAFASVRELGGLRVWSNGLTRLEAFKQVTAVREDISIGGSPQLTLLDLSSIETIGSRLELFDLPALRSLEGLRGLTTVKGENMRLRGNVGFANLRGLEHLTTVKGELSISGGGLSDLSGLDSLTSVGILNVRGTTDLRSLRGLEKLARIEGVRGMSYTSQIEGNAALTEIGGLNALTYLGSSFSISKNPKLTHLDGLHGLTSAASYFYLRDNPVLTKLDGLDALAEAQSGLFIIGNAITSLEDLRALTRVNYDLEIRESSLTNLGLRALTSVGGSLTVSDCAALPNLDGFDALSSVGIDLSIENNAALTRTDGLSHLTSLGKGTSTRGRLIVRQNPVLPPCQPTAIATSLQSHGYQGTVDIRENGGTGTCN